MKKVGLHVVIFITLLLLYLLFWFIPKNYSHLEFPARTNDAAEVLIKETIWSTQWNARDVARCVTMEILSKMSVEQIYLDKEYSAELKNELDDVCPTLFVISARVTIHDDVLDKLKRKYPCGGKNGQTH
jgi:hypothetical protein